MLSLFKRLLTPALAVSTALTQLPQASAMSMGDLHLDELQSYYSKQLGGLIKPEQVEKSVFFFDWFGGVTDINSGTLAFRLDEKQNVISPTRYLYPPQMQDLFTLDVDGFISSQGSEDFVEAKRSFYSKLKFDEKTFYHERPYAYLSDWNSLFHPPVKDLILPVTRYAKDFGAVDYSTVTSSFFSPEFHRGIDKDTASELTFGNKLHYLANGHGYQEKLRLIREAKHSILGAVMSIVCDRTGIPLVDELIRRKSEGLDVKVVMEGAYQETAFRSCLTRMRKGKIDVVLSHDLFRKGKLFALMHNKFWIRDTEEAVIGGENIFDKENSSTGFNQSHRDGDVLVNGAAVTTLVGEFIGLWNQQKKRKNGSVDEYAKANQVKLAQERVDGLRGSSEYERILGSPETRMKGVCRVVTQGPQHDMHRLGRAILDYVRGTQKHILITTPDVYYETPEATSDLSTTDLVYETLREKAKTEGVKVDLISDGMDGGAGELTMTFAQIEGRALDRGRPLKESVAAALKTTAGASYASDNYSMMKPLSEIPGIRAWMHFQYIHAKHLFIDQIATVIGSYNMEKYSGRTSQETSILCQDEDLAKQMNPILVRDLINSTPLISSN